MNDTSRNGEGTRTGRDEDHPLPPRAFILDCFGRGGSNIVWNAVPGFTRIAAARTALPPPPDGLVRFRQKKFGAARTTGDHGGREVIRIAPEELRERIDANVNRDAVARLTAEQRRTLWLATADAAAALGYGETDF